MTPEQEKLQARIDELKAFSGKTFKRKDGKNPHQAIKVTHYAGIAELADGVRAHIFHVESKNPDMAWTPIASKFLEEHEEVEAEKETATPEII